MSFVTGTLSVKPWTEPAKESACIYYALLHISRTGVAKETEVVHDELVNGEAMPAVSLGRRHRMKVMSL